MNILTSQTRLPAKASTRQLLHRAASTVAVLAIVAAAVGLPIIAPETTNGPSSVVAIARADCPPDCGGNPGGNPSGPPGGGTEFVPPSMPAMPSYESGRGYPAPDQNNSVSIYNSAAPQPSQAAQPSQAPAQNQNGSYNRAANGEQQPNQYQQAPNNQGINQDWQQLSDRLNNQTQGQNHANQPNREPDQQDQEPDRCDLLWKDLVSVGQALSDVYDRGGDDPALEQRSAELSSALNEECASPASTPAEDEDDDPKRKPKSGSRKRSGPIEPRMWTLEECQRKLQEMKRTRTHICVPVGQAGMYYHGGRWAQPPVPLGPAPPLINGDNRAGGDASNLPPGALPNPGPTAPAEPPPPYTPPPLDCGPGYHKTGEPPGGGGFPCRPDDPGIPPGTLSPY
ncbi:hypothetical protein [Mycobacterium sp. D16Q16]|uniref:hypothetical protein n=1 Tax=Mycobacterium sp. D16Q16 TaxID=1855659 RepID=UPI002570D97C|nr:hypothetical protein [Mycobacterium sp. D16Q16]